MQRFERLQNNSLTLHTTNKKRNHRQPKPSRTRGKSERNADRGKQRRITERKRKADTIRTHSSESKRGSNAARNAHKSKACEKQFTAITGRSIKSVHDTHSPADKHREAAIVTALEDLLWYAKGKKVSENRLLKQGNNNKQQELTGSLNRGMSPCDSTRNRNDPPIQLQGRARRNCCEHQTALTDENEKCCTLKRTGRHKNYFRPIKSQEIVFWPIRSQNHFVGPARLQ